MKVISEDKRCEEYISKEFLGSVLIRLNCGLDIKVLTQYVFLAALL